MLCDGGDLDHHEYAIRAAKNTYNITKNEKKTAMKENRLFLEDEIVVPTTWLEEAVAMRCGFNGDAFGHVRHAFARSQFARLLRR